MDRILDWTPHKDRRSRKFRTVAPPSTRESRFWPTLGPVLDQGQEGACVGHGMTNAVMSAPVHLRLVHPQQTAFGLYHVARFMDDEKGENYDGTEVIAGAKAAVDLGFATDYRWCFGIDDVRNSVLELGAVVLGINWYDSMYETDAQHLVTVGGKVVGGHCILVTGYTRRKADGHVHAAGDAVYRWLNSWGTEYGDLGHGYIREADLAKLLKADGEAMVLGVPAQA